MRTLLLALGVSLVPAAALAHDDFEVDATVGARFGGSVGFSSSGGEGVLSLDPGVAFGGVFGYRIEPEGFIFLSYSRQQSNLVFEIGDSRAQTPMSVEYLQFGGKLETTRGPLAPYLGFSVGVVRFAASDAGGQQWYLAGAIDGGVKVEILEHLHARVLGRLPLAFVNGASGLFCLSAAGCEVSLGADPLVQGEVQLGLGVSF